MGRTFTPMTIEEHETLGRQHLEIAAKMRRENEDPIAPGEFSRTIMADYLVTPVTTIRGGTSTPGFMVLPPEDAPNLGTFPTERAAWQAAENHRMFGDVIAPAMKDEGPTA